MIKEMENYFFVRRAKKEDYPQVLWMIEQLAAHIEAPTNAIRTSVEQLEADDDLFNCLVVELKGKGIVGIATYFYAYFSWIGKSLFIDDFIIRDELRGTGMGQFLFSKVLDEARKNNCKRVRWEVTKNNPNAIEFYKKNNAEFHEDIIVCQLEGLAD